MGRPKACVKDLTVSEAIPDFVVSNTTCGGCLFSILWAYLVQTILG